jgi:PhnB protein
MTSRLNPYISFNGNAREAMEFYRSVFGGELIVNTFAEFGNPDPEVAHLVMHSQLETPSGYFLMGADLMPGMPVTSGSTITISLSGDDSELRDYFARLGEGGTITVPLEKQVWGDEYGQVTDRYGIAWMANIGQPQP